MLKRVTLLVGAGVLAMACGSNVPAQTVGQSSGCRELGDQSQAVAKILGGESVYGANRLSATRSVSVTGTQPGTNLYVRAASGDSSEYLERVLSCHAAYGRPIGSNDPFHPQSGRVARVTVGSAGSGYEVHLVGQDSITDDEIWQRSRELAYSTVHAEQLASGNPQPVRTLRLQ
jgi:hypothetical protein